LNEKTEVGYYLGKRVVYVYRTKAGYSVYIYNIRPFGEELVLLMETME
jgi:hypothetical protein